MRVTLPSRTRIFLAVRGTCSSSGLYKVPGSRGSARSKRDDQEFYERPDGLSPEEQKEWDAMMDNPVIHDLFYGMGSSGQSGGEKPESAPGTFHEVLYCIQYS